MRTGYARTGGKNKLASFRDDYSEETEDNSSNTETQSADFDPR